MKTIIGTITAKNKKFTIVVARFNEFITKRLLDSATQTLLQAGAVSKNIEIVWVPGALEIPFVCRRLGKRKKKRDGLIALACVLRGGTYHYECVCHELTRGISQAAMESNIPTATGIITAETLEDAIDRAGLKAGNKGAQAALAILELMSVCEQLDSKKGKVAK